MRRLRKRQLKLGTIWGGIAFLTGCLITYIAVPTSFNSSVPHWQLASWFYLNANYMEISGLSSIQTFGFAGAFLDFNLIKGNPQYRYLRMIPFFTLTIASILLSVGMGYTERPRHIFENSVFTAIGYIGVGIIFVVFSSALPSISMLLFTFLIVAGALTIGVYIVRIIGTQIPIFAFITFGGLILIGLFVIFGSLTILEAFFPLIAIGFIGSQIGGILIWISRKMDV